MKKYLILALLLISPSLQAICKGKLDVAPTWMKIDVLEFGKTVRRLDISGARVSADYFVWNNIMARGTFLAGRGDANFETYSIGLGACLPYKQLYFTPHAGITYTNFRTSFDLPQFFLFHLKQHFTSYGPYVGIDAQWCITDKWRIGGGFVYAWGRTKTVVKPIQKAKSSTKGPNYTILVERDIGDKWSLNIGAGYNRSLDREKHGLKGKGIKIGLTRWF